VAGKFLGDSLKLKLTNGSEMVLLPPKIEAISYKVSPQRPDAISMTRPLLVTCRGQELCFQPADIDYTFLTESGKVKLEPKDLREIRIDTPGGGLHRAVFRNDTVLSGLLLQEEIKTKADLGLSVNLPRSMVLCIRFPGDDVDTAALCRLTLTNDDVLHGHVAEEALEIATREGTVTVSPGEVTELRRRDESLDQVDVALHSGTTVSGRLLGKSIRFKVEPGPLVPIFVGRIASIACPEPKAAPTTQP
jgi:hypothetical protein